MSMAKNLNFVLVSSLLLSLASCGDNSKSKSHREVNPICAELNCLTTVDWKIVLQGRAFPDKARVDINGTTVLNECVSKQKYTINRHSEPQELYLDNFFVPKRGEVKIHVTDLGFDCGGNTKIISNDNVEFEVNKTQAHQEILINL